VTNRTAERRSTPQLLLAVAGLLAGLITVAAEGVIDQFPVHSLTRTLLEEIYLGITFGGPIAVYFVAHQRVRSVARIAAFMVITAVAWYVAMWAATFAATVVPLDTMNGNVTPPRALFAGGWAGSLVVFSAALFLFLPGSVTWNVVRMLPAWALAGGALGVIGWWADSIIGLPLWAVAHALQLRPAWEKLDTVSLPGSEVLRWLSLFLIWQTGTALCLGFIVALNTEADVVETASEP
jgi:hypothetical protein